MKKKKEIDMKKAKIIFLVAVIVIIVLVVLLVISNSYGNYSEVKLNKNKKEIFTISDLSVDDIKYADTYDEIIKKMGKPNKEKEANDDKYRYKKLYYKGLVLTLKENYNDYMLVGAEVTNKKYKVSRGIKVKDKILKVIKKYKVENEKGTYIYGNYSVDALEEEEITENIYLAVRSKKEVVYINRDYVVDKGKTNIAKLTISYKNGKVSKISWSYDYK